MRVADTILETLIWLCEDLSRVSLDYRVTGVVAANFYGYGLSTNVIDIAVESDSDVYKAVKILQLPKQSYFGSFDPYIHYIENPGGYIRIQGDILGIPFIHPQHGFKMHSKGLLLDRLDIYAGADFGGRVEQAAAYIALTVDDDKTEKYKYFWNRL